MFLDGVGRWGFDSILETAASLVGDGTDGSALPIFLTSATNFTSNQSTIGWESIPNNLTSTWNGFALIIDDVLAWTGTATNYSITSLNASIPHYFRCVAPVYLDSLASSNFLISILDWDMRNRGHTATLLGPPPPTFPMELGSMPFQAQVKVPPSHCIYLKLDYYQEDAPLSW